MEDEHVFGTGKLSPGFVRGAQFRMQPHGGYDPAEIHHFLDQIASALEVLDESDLETMLRAEFRRNADIAQQVLEAGQEASRVLRAQASEEAQRILEEARVSAATLREEMQSELAQTRVQIDELRERFVGDLRDVHDRIGAFLYRFERGSSAASELGSSEFRDVGDVGHAADPAASNSSSGIDYSEFGGQDTQPREEMPDVSSQMSEPEIISLSPQDYDPTTPFHVVEDEPLAPGQPLINLAENVTDIDTQSHDIESEDQRAEALLAGGVDSADQEADNMEERHDIGSAPVVTADEAADQAIAVRQLILDSLAAGQDRKTIERYLSDHLLMPDPAAVIDAALASAESPAPDEGDTGYLL